MSKYGKIKKQGRKAEKRDIADILVEGEQILWQGKPKKSAFILNRIFSVFLPVVIIWGLIDCFIILVLLSSGILTEFKAMLFFIIPFFLIHLAPVWGWLSKVVTSARVWKNTQYAVTDKRIIINSGFVALDYKTLYYKDIKDVTLKEGILDRMLHVGDIYFDTSASSVTVGNSSVGANGKVGTPCFLDIPDAYELYPRLQKIVLDMQTDMAFPNDLRPDTNSGYNTQYKG